MYAVGTLCSSTAFRASFVLSALYLVLSTLFFVLSTLYSLPATLYDFVSFAL
jgi:hypothetical protein